MCRGDALAHNHAEMVDHEPLQNLRVHRKMHALLGAIKLNMIEHLQKVDQREFARPGAISERAHVERIDPDQSRFRVCAGDFLDAGEPLGLWDAPPRLGRDAGMVRAPARRGGAHLSAEVHACAFSFSPSERLTTVKMRPPLSALLEIPLRNPNAPSIDVCPQPDAFVRVPRASYR